MSDDEGWGIIMGNESRVSTRGGEEREAGLERGDWYCLRGTHTPKSGGEGVFSRLIGPSGILQGPGAICEMRWLNHHWPGSFHARWADRY